MNEAGQPFFAFDVPLEGANIVNASAGTGKTYAITSLVVRLLVEKRLPIEQVLVVTFTEAATSELRARIRSRLRAACEAFRCAALTDPSGSGTPSGSGDKELDSYAHKRRAQHSASAFAEEASLLAEALANVDQAAISTIHGFCFRVLQHAAFATGIPFDCEVAQRDSAQLTETADDFWSRLLFSSSRQETTELLSPGLRLELRQLISQTLSNPDLAVVPPRCGRPESLPDTQALYRAARESFDRDAVEQVLISSPAIAKRPTPAPRKKRCDTAADYFAPASHDGRGTQTKPLLLTVRHLLPDALGTTADALGHPFFAALEALVTALERQADIRATFKVALKHEAMEFARKSAHQNPRKAEQLSFDGLLLSLKEALMGPEGDRLVRVMREQYAAALIDEFQDTDPVQFAIFHRVYHESGLPLFMIGDPKQAIYAFRGADVYAFLHALEHATGRRYTMGINWRSAPPLVAAVNHLFRERPEGPAPFILEKIRYAPVAARPGAKHSFTATEPFSANAFELLFYPRPEGMDKALAAKPLGDDIGRLVAEDIAQLLNSGCRLDDDPIRPQNIAVLARTNQQCFDIQLELQKRQVPAVVLGDKNVFETSEAEELGWVLQALLEPTSAHRVRRALATGLLGLNANALERLEHDAEAWEGWVHLFRQLHAEWAGRGFVQMTRRLLAETGLVERLLSLLDGERRMTNLVHLIELLHIAARSAHLGPSALVFWLKQERSNAENKLSQTSEQIELRLESDAAAVKLTTIHKSKGLEFDVVYCPFLWNGSLLWKSDKKQPKFHDADGSQKIDIGSPELNEHVARAEEEALAENLRLLYVALTRAKHRCTVVWAGAADLGSSALACLVYPPPNPLPDTRTLQKRLDPLSDEEHLHTLHELCDRSDGAFGVRQAQRAVGLTRYRQPAEPPATLAARACGPRGDSWWRTTSFTALTQASHKNRSRLSPQPERDTDGAEQSTALPYSAPEPQTAEPHPEQITLAEFPRGAAAGTCYHDLLEHIDFAGSDAEWAPEIAAVLARHDFPPELCTSLGRSVREVVETPLGGLVGELTLQGILPSARVNEMEFHLPLNDEQAATLSAAQLGAAFSRFPSADVAPNYAAHLTALNFERLSGFLKGYVDLIFEHAGRYYVVDYKTNHLGDLRTDYDRARLAEAMTEAHYYLQYHLYSVALQRLLAQRIPDYDYDRHFGGVYYLFIKGMHPASASPLGIHFERPPSARLDALDALFFRPRAKTP